MEPSPGYRRYSTSALAFFFRTILGAGLGDAVKADLADEPEVDTDLVDEPEVDADLVDEPEVDTDLVDELGDEADADLDQDLEEDPEVDGVEFSACAPYLARQMSCLGSRTLGVKDAGRRRPPGELRQDLRSTYEQATQGHKEFTQV